MLKLMANILRRRPPDNAMILKNDETNKRNDDEFGSSRKSKGKIDEIANDTKYTYR
jgi:hypothetical protein